MGEKRLKLTNWLILQTTALGLLIAVNVAGLQLSSPNKLFAVATKPEVPEVGNSLIESKAQSLKQQNGGSGVEEYVRNYFYDIPIMTEIAKCESRFRQFDKDGSVLRGEKNPQDRGVMQINEQYHGVSSESLGFDIYTLEGNTAYGRYLYERYGTKPWDSSSKCWQKTVAFTAGNAANAEISAL